MLLGLLACSSSSISGSGGGGGGDGGGGGGGGGGHTGSVSVVDYAFNPATDTITHGQSITWTWGGASSHNVTFESLPDSSVTQKTGNYQVTFTNPGAYRYRCTLHSPDFGSGMHGVIVVQ